MQGLFFFFQGLRSLGSPVIFSALMPARRATKAAPAVTQTRAVEDYLEQIHNLIETKGYARVVDIAQNLGISQASVTNMIQKLDAEGYLVYERYRGVTLTEDGRRVGQAIAKRHDVLTRLLQRFGLDAETVHRDVEGMEHHISRQTLQVLTLILEELEGNGELMRKLKRRME
jgi:Mn-dependent DtxR family transcriptional regulator